MDVSKLRFNERMYPKKGWRQPMPEVESAQVNTKEPVPEGESAQENTKEPRLGFIILVHKDVPAAVQLLETIYR